MRRNYSIIWSPLLLLLLCLQPCMAGTDIIEQLSEQIAQAESSAEKSRLLMYRARNYNNIGEVELAEKDYDAALQFDHKGWIHLERSRFYMAQHEYKQVLREASAAWKETPTLKKDAQKLIAWAEGELKKKKRRESPREILLTRRWEVEYVRTPPSSSRKNVRREYAAKSRAKARQRPTSRS